MNQNIIYLTITIFAISLGIIIRTLRKLKQDVSVVKLNLDEISKQIGIVDIPIEDMSMQEVNDKLKELISKDKRMEAIKIYRIATGKNLEEAKDYINNLVQSI